MAPTICLLCLSPWRNPAWARTWTSNGYYVVEYRPDRSNGQFLWHSPQHRKNPTKSPMSIQTVGGWAPRLCSGVQIRQKSPSEELWNHGPFELVGSGALLSWTITYGFHATEVRHRGGSMSILGINCRTRLSVHIQTTNGWHSCSHHWNRTDHQCIH